MKEDKEINRMAGLLTEIRKLKNSVDLRFREAEGFNVLPLLRKPTDERYLHSRFIASFLDPRAPHGMKDRFLSLFLDTLGLKKDFVYHENTLEITPNYRTPSEKKSIDILIMDKSTRHAIIIENKIHASDQEGQLTRYFVDIVKTLNYTTDLRDAFKNIKVLYLSLDGHQPDENRAYEPRPDDKQKCIKKLNGKEETYQELKNDLPKNVLTISYGSEIIKWIEQCIKKSEHEEDALGKSVHEKNNHAFVTNLLRKYLSIIMEMTNNQEIVEERVKLVNILGTDGNWECALYILERIKHIQWHVLDLFFRELFEKMQTVAELSKDEINRLNNFIHNKRNQHNGGNLDGLEFKRTYRGVEITIKSNGKDMDENFVVTTTGSQKLELALSQEFFSEENIFKLTSKENRNEDIENIINQIDTKIQSMEEGV